MAFMTITSPHAHQNHSSGAVMRQVLLATVPGIIALCYFFGWGVMLNILWACLTAIVCEALIVYWRKRPVLYYLSDGSALVTAVLLGIALPPLAPWWVVVCGIAFAIIVVKQLYGGLGYNPFNPAMAAYVFLLISFPLAMSTWAAPSSLAQLPNFFDTFLIKTGYLVLPDAFTMATPFDIVRQNVNQAQGLSLAELKTANIQLSQFAGIGWEWVNLCFLLGGLYLLYKKVFTWHAPVAMLLTLGFCALAFYDSASSNSSGSPLFHWLSGATMLGAFFIVTDPVTSAVSNKGRLIFGALIGLLVFCIRRWGNYPDAVAFAVLLMNFAAPFIDHYTQPRTYGHSKSKGEK